MPAPRAGGVPSGRSLPEGGGDETVAVWFRVGAVWVLDRCFPRHQAERLVERAAAQQPGRVFGIFARGVDPNSPAPLEAPVITTSWYHTDSPEAIESLCEACAEARGERDRCGVSGAACEACGARPETPTTVASLRADYAAERGRPDGPYEGRLRCEDGIVLPHDPRVTTVHAACARPATERVGGRVLCAGHARRARRTA